MAFSPVIDEFVIATDNTFPGALSYTPLDNDDAILYINGVGHPTLGGSPHWSIAGVTPTYSAANAGTDMKAGAKVVAMYYADV